MSTTLGPLYERWRPVEFSEIVGQERAIKRLNVMRENTGLAGRAYWIAGPSGTGKTTLARLIAADVADAMNIAEIDSTDLSAATLGAGRPAGSLMCRWAPPAGPAPASGDGMDRVTRRLLQERRDQCSGDDFYLSKLKGGRQVRLA